MKLSSALKIIGDHDREQHGFRIKFLHLNGQTLSEDEVPARDEQAIATYEEADGLAEKLALATADKCVNIQVVYAQTGIPVNRKIRNRY